MPRREPEVGVEPHDCILVVFRVSTYDAADPPHCGPGGRNPSVGHPSIRLSARLPRIVGEIVDTVENAGFVRVEAVENPEGVIVARGALC
jgi:hypothetical protein